MRVRYKVKQVPCACVFRSVFRVCLRRFRECVLFEKYTSTVSWDYFPSGGRRVVGRKKEEYMADFCLIAKRLLTPDELRIMRYYHLLGADWKLCIHRLGMDRGSFFHIVYRIEEKLGRAYAETEPYALFPPAEYFGGAVKASEPTSVLISDPVAEREALRVPMLLSA
jgi:hypothetical protein